MKLSIVIILVLFIRGLALGQVDTSLSVNHGDAYIESFSLTNTSTGRLNEIASTSVDSTSTLNVFQTTFDLAPVALPTGINSTATTSLPLPSFSHTSLSTATETAKSGAKSLAVEAKHVMIGLAAMMLGYMI